MTIFRRTALLLVGLAAGLNLSTASAALEEMIVSSERRDASLQDVPIAVTALDSEKLDEYQIYEASDLQRYVPSLNMFNNVTSPTNLSPSLRGGLQQDASLVTAESPFGMYVDDIYVGRLNGNNVTMSDIERVEVLRGPQGTLYGRNTAYGAIRFISRTPGDDLWADASVGVGNYDQIRVNGSVGGPLGELFAGSLAAQYTTKDEQFFNVSTNQKEGLNENTSVRGKLRFKGSDSFDAVLSVSYSDSKNDANKMPKGVTPNVASSCADIPPTPDNPAGGCNNGKNAQFKTSDIAWVNGEFTVATPAGAFLNGGDGTTIDPTLAPSPLGAAERGETQQSISGLTLTWDITEGLALKSITGYVGIDDYFHNDFSGNTGNGDPANNFQVFAFTGASDIKSDQFTQEFQLLGTIGDSINYLGGIFYLDEDADQSFGWNGYNINFDAMGNLTPGFVPVSQSIMSTSIKSISAFGEGSWTFFEQLTVTAGLRWTEDDKDFNATWNGFGASVPKNFEGKYDEWTPKLAVDYAFNTGGAVDSFLLYGSAAKGFKGGGFSAIAIFSPNDFGVYGPETNWT
jgi:iron complex outermembrane receptor protein